MTPSKLYHVVGPNFHPGEPLLCWNRLYELGCVEDYDWRWNDGEYDPETAQFVSLFRSLAEAKEFAEDWGGKIIEVKMDEDQLTEDPFQYPAAYDEIEAENVRLLPGFDFPYVGPRPREVWDEYQILKELPDFPDDGEVDINLRVFEASDGLYFYCQDEGVNDTSECDGYHSAYRATKAGVERYRSDGYRVTYVTNEACEWAACEMGVAVERGDGTYLVPNALLRKPEVPSDSVKLLSAE